MERRTKGRTYNGTKNKKRMKNNRKKKCSLTKKGARRD
jgi:hypothetical protein